MSYQENDNRFNIYLDNTCYLAGYPYNYDEKCFSYGKITRISNHSNYRFYHVADTEAGSSGSPVINDRGYVIGIHTSGIEALKQNKGTFIGRILDKLKKDNIKFNRDDIAQTPCQQNGLSPSQNSSAYPPSDQNYVSVSLSLSLSPTSYNNPSQYNQALSQSPPPNYIIPYQYNQPLPQSHPPNYIIPYQYNPIPPQSPKIIIIPSSATPINQPYYQQPIIMNIPVNQFPPVQIHQNITTTNIYNIYYH